MGRTQCAPAPSGSGRAEEYRSGQESAACATRSLVCSRHFGQSGKLLLSRGEVCPGLIPSPNAPALVTRTSAESSLRTWGLKLKERIGFKRAAVAVARKLAVVMHAMLR